MEEAASAASPSTQPSTQPNVNPAPHISVAEGHYKPVGDFTFGRDKKIVHEPGSPFTYDQLRQMKKLEDATEDTIRQVLEKWGLRIRRNDTWIRVMNKAKKNLFEIREYVHPDEGGYHIFHKGRLLAKVSYPWLDINRHVRFWVQ